MAATTFTWDASYPATQTSQPIVKTFKTADGYEQRLRYGLKTDFKQWDLVFMNRTATERSAILTFLNARAGVEQFNWTSPHGGNEVFICQDWTVENTSYDNFTIRATFRQVIDL